MELGTRLCCLVSILTFTGNALQWGLVVWVSKQANHQSTFYRSSLIEPLVFERPICQKSYCCCIKFDTSRYTVYRDQEMTKIEGLMQIHFFTEGRLRSTPKGAIEGLRAVCQKIGSLLQIKFAPCPPLFINTTQ